MKLIYFVFAVIMIFSSGCGMREREEALGKRENEINQKEQRLLLLEKQLQLKHDELQQRQRSMDSTKMQMSLADSADINPAIIGNWTTTMRCTATTCDGSAVGDTKIEQWEMSYQGTTVIVKARADNQLVRTYTGLLNDNSLQLTAQQDEASAQTKMMVRLNMKSATEMDGEREIVRANNCQIVYALTMRKG